MSLENINKGQNILCLSPDELWLKGRNQPFYWKVLRSNIISMLKDQLGLKFHLEVRNQRVFVFLYEELSDESIQEICLLPGINKIQKGFLLPLDWGILLEEIQKHGKYLFQDVKTFGVRVRRANKGFSKNSLEIQKELGTFILENFPYLSVNLTSPDLWFDLRVLNSSFYFFSKSYRASGGLPVGSSGKLVSLISGGIDSSVATYLMATRGCKQDLLFCYAYPFVTSEVEDKVSQLAKRLSLVQSGLKLHIVPFAEVLEKVSDFCKEEYRTLFFRHCMLRTAELLANRLGYSGIVTGDSLAQVSSQTLSNIAVLDNSTELPILRPLIGLNKSDIIYLARKIGTYEISIQPYDDACSFLSGKSPVLRADKNFWFDLVKENCIDSLLKLQLDNTRIYKSSSFKNHSS